MTIRHETMGQKASTSYALMLALVAAIGGFLFGYDTAVINGAVAALGNAFHANSVAVGLAVSSALLGSAVGAFFAGQLADRLGRIKVMVAAAILFVISGIGSAFAFGIPDFIIWRLMGGVAIGAASVIAPAYIAEVSPAHLRGRLGSLQQLAIVTGIFAALLSDYFLAVHAGSAEAPLWAGIPAWRWMFLTEVPPAVIYGIGALMIPESPRYLVARGRDREAASILSRLVGGDVEAKVQEIRQTVLRERKPHISDLFSRGSLLPIVWIGIGLSVLQQFVGINVIFYYSSVLWRAVGFSERDSLSITVITSVVNIVTTLIAIAFVDKFGRKPLLILGSIGMTITLGTMAVVFGHAPLDAAGNPTLQGSAGTVCPVCCQSVCLLLRLLLGTDRVGALGRNVQQQDSRSRTLPGRCRPMDCKLRGFHDLPTAEGHWLGCGVWAVHDRGSDLAVLCPAPRQRDTR